MSYYVYLIFEDYDSNIKVGEHEFSTLKEAQRFYDRVNSTSVRLMSNPHYVPYLDIKLTSHKLSYHKDTLEEPEEDET